MRMETFFYQPGWLGFLPLPSPQQHATHLPAASQYHVPFFFPCQWHLQGLSEAWVAMSLQRTML